MKNYWKQFEHIDKVKWERQDTLKTLHSVSTGGQYWRRLGIQHPCVRYHSSPVHQLHPEKAGIQPKEAVKDLNWGYNGLPLESTLHTCKCNSKKHFLRAFKKEYQNRPYNNRSCVVLMFILIFLLIYRVFGFLSQGT